MKIIVISDTHGMRDFSEVLMNKHPDAKYFLHAGDSELNEYELEPFRSVKGNCDYYIKNKVLITTIMGVKIYMFHGDYIPLDEDVLVSIAKNNDCKIIIHGHTHIPYYNYTEGVHILCPGSLAYPRVSKATYAIITFNNENDIKVEIKNYGY